MFNQFFVNLFSLLIFYKLKGEIHTFAQKCIHFCALLLSPPTRVAWIETRSRRQPLPPRTVATHTGGVDRNACTSFAGQKRSPSPPTRVAWIETSTTTRRHTARAVATHTGGVDRNSWLYSSISFSAGRHPHGWRG